MRKIFLSLLAAAALTASAGTYNYLNIATSAVESSVALVQLKKITFEGNNLVVTGTDGSASTFALADLDRLYFSNTSTAVRSVRQDGLSFRNGHIVANGQGVLSIYNSNGALVRQQTVSGSRSEVNIGMLPTGIYIVRLGNRTIKVAR